MHFLSFDCANKTFAWVRGTIAGVIQVEVPGNVVIPAAGAITVTDYNVVDNLGGASLDSVDPVTRIRMLHDTLNNKVEKQAPGDTPEHINHTYPAPPNVSQGLSPGADTVIFIEYQMGPNAASNAIATALAMYYIARGHKKIIVVGPSCKNTFGFTRQLLVSEFQPKYSTSRAAIKAHTAANFAHFIAQNVGGNPTMAKSLVNHAGDAFMQVIGYLLANPNIAAGLDVIITSIPVPQLAPGVTPSSTNKKRRDICIDINSLIMTPEVVTASTARTIIKN